MGSHDEQVEKLTEAMAEAMTEVMVFVFQEQLAMTRLWAAMDWAMKKSATRQLVHLIHGKILIALPSGNGASK